MPCSTLSVLSLKYIQRNKLTSLVSALQPPDGTFSRLVFLAKNFQIRAIPLKKINIRGKTKINLGNRNSHREGPTRHLAWA
jgi:hypothetical protein